MVEFITTTTEDGVIFSGARTVGKKNNTVIVDIHGLSWDFYTTNFYKYFYNSLNENGVDFIAGETRGSYKMKSFQKRNGDYLESGGAFEIFEDCVKDIKAWINKAEELGYENILLSGYSYGPTKTSYYYSQTNDKRIKGLIFFSPSDIYGLVNEPNEKDRHLRLVEEAENLMKIDKGDTLLSEKLWSVEVFSAHTYLSLFKNPNAYIFNYFEPSLGFEALHKIDIPVLSFTGTKDEGIILSRPIEGVMDLLFNNLINSPKKDVQIIEGADHSFDGFEEDLLDSVADFVRSV